MSLKRSFLETMGLSKEQIDAIMEEHVSTVDALKADRDQYKAEAAKLPEVQKQLDDLKGGEDFKAKYDEEHRAFEEFRAETARKADEAKVKAAYRDLLTNCKISDKRLDAICKVTDFSSMKLDKNGYLENADKLTETIRSEWGEFITQTREKGAAVETPPERGNASMTKADILAIKDTSVRQKAIAENHQLFGF